MQVDSYYFASLISTFAKSVRFVVDSLAKSASDSAPHPPSPSSQKTGERGRTISGWSSCITQRGDSGNFGTQKSLGKRLIEIYLPNRPAGGRGSRRANAKLGRSLALPVKNKLPLAFVGSYLVGLLLASSVGCSMTAPMFVWQPPLNQPRAIKSIALAPLHGDNELAAKLDRAMIESQPAIGDAVKLLHPKLLEEMTSIQLASFDGRPSDVAGLSAARRANADVFVQGQIVRARLDPQEPKHGRLDFRKRPSEEIVVSWTVTDVATGERLKSEILTLDREMSEAIYPDITAMQGDPVDRVVMAVSRQSWKIFSPMTNKEEANLALPWLSLGSSRTRQGNGYARQGRWDLAEEKWQDVASKHPKNKAAWNNLSLAAAAREDFELARDRIEHAKTIVPWDRARKTERWIDDHQHNYHRALGLPDREGGWLMPDPPPPKPIEDTPSVEANDIDDLPWWTSIPGTKPPGWTWGQWLTQPRVM